MEVAARVPSKREVLWRDCQQSEGTGSHGSRRGGRPRKTGCRSLFRSNPVAFHKGDKDEEDRVPVGGSREG